MISPRSHNNCQRGEERGEREKKGEKEGEERWRVCVREGDRHCVDVCVGRKR